jgi:hypothetical protein
MSDRRKNDPYNPRVNYYPETQDVVVWQRFRDMALREALNPAWATEIHRLHHLGRIFTDELLVAERYARDVAFLDKAKGIDPDVWRGDKYLDEILENRRIMKAIRKLVPSVWRDRLDDLVIRCQVISLKDLDKARKAMILLKTFYADENKRATRKG